MYIIAGLGNPGKEYAGSRHNVGFMTLDELADRYNICLLYTSGSTMPAAISQILSANTALMCRRS